MASLTIGRSLEPFDPQTEDFEAYAERLEQYLLLAEIILSLVGPSVTSTNVLDIWHEHAGQAVQKRRLRIEYRWDYIGVLKGINTKRVWIEVELNGIPLKMKLDTGASVSLVSKKTWRDLLL